MGTSVRKRVGSHAAIGRGLLRATDWLVGSPLAGLCSCGDATLTLCLVNGCQDRTQGQLAAERARLLRLGLDTALSSRTTGFEDIYVLPGFAADMEGVHMPPSIEDVYVSPVAASGLGSVYELFVGASDVEGIHRLPSLEGVYMIPARLRALWGVHALPFVASDVEGIHVRLTIEGVYVLPAAASGNGGVYVVHVDASDVECIHGLPIVEDAYGVLSWPRALWASTCRRWLPPTLRTSTCCRAKFGNFGIWNWGFHAQIPQRLCQLDFGRPICLRRATNERAAALQPQLLFGTNMLGNAGA